MKKTLKQIVESFEQKLLYKYRFDKSAAKKGKTCGHCEYFKNGYCEFFDDKVNHKYTCNKFEKKENGKKEKE